MTISVAMCTYNGAAYLREQLDSIAAQTRLPDELVACDDCSMDATMTVLEEFARYAPFPVHLHRNEATLGSTRNFDRAIGLCRGDLIALSDQDDVWQPEKLRRLEAPFADPDVGLVFSDADVVDEALRPLGMRLWDTYFPPPLQRRMAAGQAFEVEMGDNVVTGATMAFRADLRALALPIPGDIYMLHDGWIALVAATVSRLVFLPDPLILYRRHPNQQVGIGNAAVIEHRKQNPVLPRLHYLNHLRQIETIHARLTAYGGTGVRDLTRDFEQLRAQAAHIRARLALPAVRRRRAPFVLKELATGRYHRYSNGFRSAVRDFLFPLEEGGPV